MVMSVNEVVYEHAGTSYKDQFIYPESFEKPAPVVIVIPDYHGFTPYVQAEARWLSEMGFVGYCVDIYGEQAMPKSSQDAAKRVMPLFNNRADTLKRTHAALEQACSLQGVDSTRSGVIGFSSGGLFALDMARRIKSIRAVASVWGVALPWELKPAPMIEPNVDGARLLLIHGTKDVFNPMESNMNMIRELDEAGTDYQLILLGGKKHAFSLKTEDNLEVIGGEEPQALLYDEVADQRAHHYVKHFFSEAFEECFKQES